ncbi:FecR family protein [Pedobacter heparinus]|jgi:ferric-dicitrate binding protein FerR (iron transport regulator)|uniref:FecR protein n=1 Tax=Pedobacter heparinus (strain ATCC 13125 / DSM 2366 / CIP 104194 / JCM 7457 / NBRC 12017 / NCIMB 9290 / NRRL B-14731 / HIM 762-3) TaxID=485917 RepID=C6XZ47_PEDHD|nr:FecR domain-containing protein [Pedobacter heparinus]ACU02529.1 FecR protein [Pedobacter heparinus DSM 2366]
MNRTKEQFEKLLNKYIDKSCSLEELKELFSYMELPEYEERLKIIMDENYTSLVPGTAAEQVDWEEMFATITGTSTPKKVRPLWAVMIPVAAAVLLILSVGILIWGNQGQVKDSSGAPAAKLKKDIAPGGNRAVLKLADGTEIVLDGHATGVLANEGKTKISKTKDGMLLYDASGTDGTESSVNINTLSTPSGGQYMLILPDRTRVWLNAESAISYPSVFSGTERTVTLTGEAYFEVTKDKQHPFKVKTGAAEIKVLGTHFNIMSYADEGQTQISLAEGSVRVELGKAAQILFPGQQALIKPGTTHIALKQVDIDEVTDWKNGLFQFDNTPIEQVMRQIKRWYNVDIVYEGIKPDLYITGMVSRSNNVSKILELIAETGGVNFEIGD